jgi:hypothetical protein
MQLRNLTAALLLTFAAAEKFNEIMVRATLSVILYLQYCTEAVL